MPPPQSLSTGIDVNAPTLERVAPEEGEERPLKKTKSSGKPIQTTAWSNKTDAAAKKEIRRLKKLKRVKSVNGVLVREREEDEGMDWKDVIRESKESRKKERGGKNDMVAMSAPMEL